MKRALPFAVIFAAMVSPAVLEAKDLGLERGLAITNPDVLERLEKKGFSLVALLSPGWTRGADAPLGDNRKLSALPAMEPVVKGVVRVVAETEQNYKGAAGVDIFKFPTKRLFNVKYLSIRRPASPLSARCSAWIALTNSPPHAAKFAFCIGSSI